MVIAALLLCKKLLKTTQVLGLHPQCPSYSVLMRRSGMMDPTSSCLSIPLDWFDSLAFGSRRRFVRIENRLWLVEVVEVLRTQPCVISRSKRPRPKDQTRPPIKRPQPSRSKKPSRGMVQLTLPNGPLDLGRRVLDVLSVWHGLAVGFWCWDFACHPKPSDKIETIVVMSSVEAALSGRAKMAKLHSCSLSATRILN